MESANSNALPIDADGFHFLYSYAISSLNALSFMVGLVGEGTMTNSVKNGLFFNPKRFCYPTATQWFRPSHPRSVNDERLSTDTIDNAYLYLHVPSFWLAGAYQVAQCALQGRRQPKLGQHSSNSRTLPSMPPLPFVRFIGLGHLLHRCLDALKYLPQDVHIICFHLVGEHLLDLVLVCQFHLSPQARYLGK
jgi:hypothetical protein